MSSQQIKEIYDDTGNRRVVIVRDESGTFSYRMEERIESPLSGMHWSRLYPWHPSSGLYQTHESEEAAENHALVHVDWLKPAQAVEQGVEGFLLSPQQKRLLSLDATFMGYWAHCAVQLKDKWEAELIDKKLNEVVARHGILRTGLSYLPGMTSPIQVIYKSPNYALTCSSSSPLNAEELHERVESVFDAAQENEINLHSPSPLNAHLLTLSPDIHILLISLPAFYADLKTLDNLIEELYISCVPGEQDKLEDEVLQYVDYSNGQYALLESDEAKYESKAAKEYWESIHSEIIGCQGKILVCDRKFNSVTTRRLLRRETISNLGRLAEGASLPIHTLILSCWQLFLLMWSEESKVIVGTYCDGRNYEELKKIFGVCGKYLPLLRSVEPGQSVLDFIKQTNIKLMEASTRQDYFSWDLFNDPGQVATVFLPYCFEFHESSLQRDEYKFTILERRSHVDRFELKLSCFVMGDDITCEFHRDSDAFCQSDIDGGANQFLKLLDRILELPSILIDDLKAEHIVERRA